MEQTGYIVAIEVGSSRCSGIVGKRNSDGNIHVLSYVTEPSSSFIKKGVVFNIDKTAMCLTNIINRLEGESDMTVSKVYVGLGGKSMHTVSNLVARTFGEETKVTQTLIDAMNDENLETVYPDQEIVLAVPQEYKLDNSFNIDPVGVISKSVEGRYRNVVASLALKRRLHDCLNNAKVDDAFYLISPVCLADAVLPDLDKRSGCVLVDFGADTTTVSIYKNNILRSLVVLPIGGSNITHDLSLILKIDEDEAEELKLKYGEVVPPIDESGEAGEKIKIPTTGNEIDKSYLDEIVSARAEEIVANVWNVIQQSGYESQLFSGIFVTGGASNLPGLMDMLEKKCKRMRVRRARNVWSLMMQDCVSPVDESTISDTLLALLLAGKESCCTRSTLSDGNLFDHSEVEIQQPAEPEQPAVNPPAEEHKSEDENSGRKKDTNQKKKNKNSTFDRLVKKLFGEEENTTDQ